ISKELKVIANRALVDVELESLSLFKLLKTFEKVMERYEDEHRKKKVHTVVDYNYTIQGQQIFILSKVKKGVKTGFISIFGKCENRVHAIVTFLGMLELLNLDKLKIVQGEGINNFWLTL
ncbi:MAG: chromosome segregation protein ScpA, partial [Bacteroidota bacterium]